MLELYKKFCTDYPVVTIEDPFEQDDWDNCAAFTKENVCQVVGDDILVTNPTRVKKAIDGKTVNALLLKVRGWRCCALVAAGQLGWASSAACAAAAQLPRILPTALGAA
jgi:hypothetical protein